MGRVCMYMLVPRITAALGLAGVLSLSLALGVQKTLKQVVLPHPAYAGVAPIFKQNCVGCHSGPHPKNGLDLSTYASMMKGDKDGKAIVPGKPDVSRLSLAIHHKLKKPSDSMPPGRTLSAGDIAKIDAWIRSGAKEK